MDSKDTKILRQQRPRKHVKMPPDGIYKVVMSAYNTFASDATWHQFIFLPSPDGTNIVLGPQSRDRFYGAKMLLIANQDPRSHF